MDCGEKWQNRHINTGGGRRIIVHTASIPLAEIGEAPDVAETDGVGHDREHVLDLRAPLVAISILRLFIVIVHVGRLGLIHSHSSE